MQWIQLLQALNQQGTSNFFNIVVLKLKNTLEGGWHALDHNNVSVYMPYEVNGIKESVSIS